MPAAPPPIRLVPPTVALRDTFLDAARAFQAEGLPWWGDDHVGLAFHDFPAFVAGKLAEADPATDGRLPKTHRWAVLDGAFVGRIAVFHKLDAALRRSGGHIGYDVVPAHRGRGIATAMLRAMLPVAREVGLTEVLLTCDASNAASIRVIERNGGVLHGHGPAGRDGRPKRVHRIRLGTPPPDRGGQGG